MSDIAGNIGNAIIKTERGTKWRFVAASKLRNAVARTVFHLSHDSEKVLLCASSEHTFGKSISLHDSESCCGCIVHLEHPDRVPSPVWWRVSYFFDRDGKEANVFVWSEPEKQFFRRSQEWFNKRSR
jgi:hypothetical protein